tara:strand:+ start:397 stop:675 length:279 start_codon:yes stop_codon:yes gene_type:complete
MNKSPAKLYNGDDYVAKLMIMLDIFGEPVVDEKSISSAYGEWTKIVWDRGSYEKSAKKETKKSKSKSEMEEKSFFKDAEDYEDTVEDNGDSD